MSKYANVQAVPLSMQIFLATDYYDYNDNPKTISATSLIKPLRQLILGSRVKPEDASVDLVQMVASRIGTAIHNGIEHAWTHNYKQAMKDLGYPQSVIDRIVINKPIDEVTENDFPIYFEQRSEKEILGYKISGKFDFIAEGVVEDFKSTSVYTHINSTNDDKYRLQGSIYRWLNPRLITSNQMAIQFIFTDWSSARAKTDNGYPQSRIHRKTFDLLSLEETENFIKNKLLTIQEYWDKPENEIPECTDEDLWRSGPVYKYYKNPEKLQRSTKNFDSKQEAYVFMSQQGTGTVIEKPGQVTACRYCSGFSICSQKDKLYSLGELSL
jgi:hypothetical protein